MSNSRLSSLRQSMLDMSPDELRAHIQSLRADRKITKGSAPAAKKAKKATGAAVDKAKKKAQSALDKLTPEQIAKLLRELGNGSGTQGSDSG
jgi:hypothetical protein